MGGGISLRNGVTFAQDGCVEQTRLYYAAEAGRTDVVELMLKFLSENPRKDLLQDALYVAPFGTKGNDIIEMSENAIDAL